MRSGAPDDISLTAGWWHSLGGSMGGLALLLFGKFDFDELLASAFPFISGSLFTAFCFCLVLVGVNALVGAGTASYAKRYEDAYQRWVWLRFANCMRAETGFIGGALKHRQLRAVRCSRSVPLGYTLCDVLRPEAYCHALPPPPPSPPRSSPPAVLTSRLEV